MPRLDELLRGPHLRLPRPIDAISESWSRLAPRARMVLTLTFVVVTVLAFDARTQAVDHRWGGSPQPVLVATADLHVGDPLEDVRRTRLPPAAVPPAALESVPPGAVLALALPRGAVVTRLHVDPRGAAAALDEGMRAVPIPTEEGWGVVEGGWVDVWTLGTGDRPAQLVAESRPVLDVRDDTMGLTSLVGLAGGEVAAVTRGLALGRVLLAHAPAAADESR